MYTSVVGCLLSDLVGKSYSKTECERDTREIVRRVRAQGISFLTKSLPRFGKAIDLALAKGIPLSVTGFKKKHGTELPEFLWELTSQVFDSNGCELPLGNAHVLKSLRQILYCFYKLELPYDDTTTKAVLDGFIEVDNQLDFHKSQLRDGDLWVIEEASRIIRCVLANSDPLDIIPRHGPGAVADGLKPHQKPHITRYNARLGSVFCYGKYFHYNNAHLADRLDQFLDLPESEVPARVVLVPKDSRGPRLISCEPTENQWIQQGLCRNLYDTIESHWLTRSYVNFIDQTVNQWYAYLGSRNGAWVTLDMKDASDRVSLELVRALFPENWVRALEASRSTHTKLPDGRVVALKKFAPMGSAVCFPVESLIFYALCVAAIMRESGLGRSDVLGSIRVYGDDIVVRTEYHGAILQYLPKVGLMFNDGKCCTTGFFRESCGFDAYRGTDVTPTKIRSVYTVNRASSNRRARLAKDTYASWVAYSNAFYEAGYYKTAAFIEEEIRKLHPETPYLCKEAGVIAFVRSDKEIRTLNRNSKAKFRFNRNTHTYEVRAWKSTPRNISVRHPGYEDLLTKVTSSPLADSEDVRGVFINPQTHKVTFYGGWLPSEIKETLDTECVLLSVLSRSSPDLPVLGNYTIPRRDKLQQGWTAVPS